MVGERVRAWLRTLVGRSEEPTGDGTALFKERYHALRLLLAANNRALDAMAEMEQAAFDGRVFGMAFVQSRCTAVSVSTYTMVRHLDELATNFPGIDTLGIAVDECVDRVAQHGVDLVGKLLGAAGHPS